MNLTTEQLARNSQIRAELLGTKGAGLCAIGSCQVITQGGRRGAIRHQEVVHKDVWLNGDSE